MLAKFFIVLLAIFVAGPLENEGGSDAIEAKGVKSVEQALKEGDVSTLKGNYGNQ